MNEFTSLEYIHGERGLSRFLAASRAIARIALLATALGGYAWAQTDQPTRGEQREHSGADTSDAKESAMTVRRHIDEAVAREVRPEADRARDVHRKPADVLAFCDIRPGAVVADLMAGTGYYTEILSAAVGPEGRVYGHNSPFVLARYAEKPWSERLERMPHPNVVRIDAEPEKITLPERADVALLVRFYHDFYWQKVDRAAFNSAVLALLKPDGVFCVLDHHAQEGSRDRDVQTLHRVDAAMVRAEIEAAGFTFDAQSDVLRAPGDDRTWNVFADDAARRDQTDRFLYRFRPSR